MRLKTLEEIKDLGWKLHSCGSYYNHDEDADDDPGLIPQMLKFLGTELTDLQRREMFYTWHSSWFVEENTFESFLKDNYPEISIENDWVAWDLLYSAYLVGKESAA